MPRRAFLQAMAGVILLTTGGSPITPRARARPISEPRARWPRDAPGRTERAGEPPTSLAGNGAAPVGPQLLAFDLPPLGAVQTLNWLVPGSAGDFVQVAGVELVVEVPALPTGGQAFLWSDAQFLANFKMGG